MIAAEPHRSGVQKEAHAQGWLVSVLLHSTVALAAILLVKQIQLAPQDESFKWNVAIGSPTQSVKSTASSRSESLAQFVPSTTPVPPHIERTAAARTALSPTSLAQQATPSISEQAAASVVANPPTQPLSQAPAPSQSAVHTTQPAEPIRHEAVASMAVAEESVAPTAPSSASEDFEQTAPSDQAPLPTQVASISPTVSNTPMKRDYGWLTEMIVRRVEELKRYPASARVDRAEGKVVVKAVVNEDGSIGAVEVFQSSGHSGLDKAAIETLRQAAPFQLPRSLGKPGMTIKIPMNYRLDR